MSHEQINFLRGRQKVRFSHLLKLWQMPWQVRGDWWEQQLEETKQAWLDGEALLMRAEFLK